MIKLLILIIITEVYLGGTEIVNSLDTFMLIICPTTTLSYIKWSRHLARKRIKKARKAGVWGVPQIIWGGKREYEWSNWKHKLGQGLECNGRGWRDRVLAFIDAYVWDKDTKYSHPELVKVDSENSAGAKPCRYMNTGLPLLPNIRAAEVTNKDVNGYLKLFGIQALYGREVKLYGGLNHKSNRYLKHSYKRMLLKLGCFIQERTESVYHNGEDLAGVCTAGTRDVRRWVFPKDYLKGEVGPTREESKRIAQYWRIGFDLLRRSSAYRVALLHSILGKRRDNQGREVKWYLHKTINELEEMNREFDSICKKNFSQEANTWRTWIESPPGKPRPLGVSSDGWRLYLKGVTTLLECAVRGSWSEDQHAYMTGRGTFTAWQQIVKEALPARDIFEVDLRAFFNSVHLEEVGRTLKRLGTPKWVTGHLLNIAGCVIKSPALWKVKRLVSQIGPEKFSKYEYIYSYRKGYRYKGLPQGQGCSPILSVLVLTLLSKLPQGVKVVVYADDIVLYGDLPDNIEEILMGVLNPTGVSVATEKSGWVKKNGVWKKNLKFLGLSYDPWVDVLSSDTRKGRKLPLLTSVLGIFTGEGLSRLASFHHKLHSDKLKMHLGVRISAALARKCLRYEHWYELNIWSEFVTQVVALGMIWYCGLQMAKGVFPLSHIWFFLGVIGVIFTLQADWFVTSLTWRNTFTSRYLFTILARLYVGSWSGDPTPQDFRLSWTRDSLQHLYRRWMKIIGGGPSGEDMDGNSIGWPKKLNVFNASSYYCNMLETLLKKEWRTPIGLRTELLWKPVLDKVWHRISNRRCGEVINEHNRAYKIGKEGYVRPVMGDVMLFPPKHQKAPRKHFLECRRQKKLALKKGLGWEALYYMFYSESYLTWWREQPTNTSAGTPSIVKYRGPAPNSKYSYSLYTYQEKPGQPGLEAIQKPAGARWLTWEPKDSRGYRNEGCIDWKSRPGWVGNPKAWKEAKLSRDEERALQEEAKNLPGLRDRKYSGIMLDVTIHGEKFQVRADQIQALMKEVNELLKR